MLTFLLYLTERRARRSVKCGQQLPRGQLPVFSRKLSCNTWHSCTCIPSVCAAILRLFFFLVYVLMATADDVLRDLGTDPIFESGASTGGETPERRRQPEPDVEEHSADEAAVAASADEAVGGTATQQEASLKKRKWRGTDEINRMWFKSVGAEVELDCLSWDLKQEFGQTRPLDDQYVQKLCESLRSRPPTAPIRCTLWENVTERRLYILAGQHICRPVAKVRDERLQQGLRLEKWHQVVQADIMKADTPLQHRRTIAGASNASARLQRTTGITECIKQILRLETEPDMNLNDRILTAVENCGLNAPSSTPVCPVCLSFYAACGVHLSCHACRNCIMP